MAKHKLSACGLSTLVCLMAWLTPPAIGETLYNGIVLPAPWPPQKTDLSHCYPNPVLPYYLQAPPSVIPIDVGRQLFVDGFLVQSTTLTRNDHLPQYHSASPVLRPQTAWEGVGGDGVPQAMTFSDGVWWDPSDRLFKMWYIARNTFTCMATSRDGIRWQRPALNVTNFYPNSNIVNMPVTQRDSAMIWLDLNATDPNQRYRMTYYRAGLHNCMSADGLNWYLTIPGDLGYDRTTGHPDTWDRTTFFYNPFRNRWVYSLRYHAYVNGLNGARARKYYENNDWTAKMPANSILNWWWGADTQDLPYPGYDVPTQLYNLDVAPYESVMLGYFSIWHGDCSSIDTPKGLADRAKHRPKLNAVKIGYSRDGWYWHRPDRRQFLPFVEDPNNGSPRPWNYGNVQSAGGGGLVMGDTLYIYCSGRNHQGAAAVSAGEGEQTGLALLRRDGFTSMDAGATPGELLTRPVRFQGRRLFVNVDNPLGELRVEVLDANSQPIAPFTLANCRPASADSTLLEIHWSGATDLSALIGQTVRFRFRLTSGKLYAFWVSPDASGASYGYVIAGGPGYTTNRDTVGKAAYAAAYAINQVDAGLDRTISLPAPASLDGTMSNASLPAGQSWTPAWSLVDGPGVVTFGNPAAVDTTATFSTTGVYLLRLTITDGWLKAYDELTVTVESPNVAPTVAAGNDQTISVPFITVSLDGAVSDDGLPNPPGACTVAWSKFSGPGTVIFASAADTDTEATFSTFGTYVLRLTANDSALSAQDDVTVTVTGDLRADFNDDGRVDGLDFLVWQAGFPRTTGGTKSTGDANGDGAVDGLDFLIWQTGYRP